MLEFGGEFFVGEEAVVFDQAGEGAGEYAVFAFFEDGDGIQAAGDDDADAAVSDGQLQQGLAGHSDLHDGAESHLVEAPADIDQPPAALPGDLAEAGPDQTVAVLDGPVVVGHAATDKDFQGINAGAFVVDHLGKTGKEFH